MAMEGVDLTDLDNFADGYVATVKCGVVTVVDDELTGERPGRVVRGATA